MINSTNKVNALELLENLAGVMRKKIDDFKTAGRSPVAKEAAQLPGTAPQATISSQQVQKLFDQRQHDSLV